MDLVSLIVPVYNAEKFLDKCILSMINQTYKNIEVILVNDGSCDGSLNICNKYAGRDSRINVINKDNSGVSGARNKGMKFANGKWICFVDADDYIDIDFVENIVKLAEDNNAEFVISGVREISKNSISEFKHSQVKIISSDDEKEELINAVMCYKQDKGKILTPQILGYPFGKLFSKEVLSNIKFKTDISIREDALFNIEVINKVGIIIITDLVKYNYILQNNSASISFHPDYSEEVIRYNQYCKEYCHSYNISIDNYYINVLYSYMMWMKLFAMNDKQNCSFFNRYKIIKNTFYDNNWNEAFKNVSYSALSNHYKVLKWLFNHKCSIGIVMIYRISNLIH